LEFFVNFSGSLAEVRRVEDCWDAVDLEGVAQKVLLGPLAALGREK
jgi:hypothetical protein